MRMRAVPAGTGVARGALAAARLGAALAVATAWLWAAAAALGADPTASPAGGDVRTTPAAPGLAGEPLLAVLGVVLVGAIAVGITLAAARLTPRR
jgi:hypothetical protein